MTQGSGHPETGPLTATTARPESDDDDFIDIVAIREWVPGWWDVVCEVSWRDVGVYTTSLPFEAFNADVVHFPSMLARMVRMTGPTP